MAFWGCEVKPGKATPFVPPPEASKLHLSQACLSTKAKPGAKAALRVKVGEEGQPLLVCSLREGAAESVGLDLIFDQYTEFSVEGAAAIHLTGYYMPEYEMDHGEDDTDEDDGEFPGGRLLGYDEYGVPIMEGDIDSEEESDEEYASEEESDEDEDGDLNPPRRVVIEDVTEQERGGKAAPKALPAPAANGKAAAFEDADVSGSDEDEEEVDEEDSEEGSDDEEMESDAESESQSEEEEEEARQAAAKQAQQAQQAGQKRKAEAAAAAAKQPPAKAAKQQAAATPAEKKQPAAQQAKTPATAPAKQAAQQVQQQAPATAPAKQQQKEQQKDAGKAKVRSFPNGFIIEELKAGRPDGKLAKAGKKVVMRYIGKLKSNGKVFDQTRGNATFSFRLGVGEVIKGWDRGVEGMRVGDKRRLTIPPQMAYGTSGVRGTIPGNATLMFDVELVDVK